MLELKQGRPRRTPLGNGGSRVSQDSDRASSSQCKVTKNIPQERTKPYRTLPSREIGLPKIWAI